LVRPKQPIRCRIDRVKATSTGPKGDRGVDRAFV
jgi:hypothetical protein